MNRAWLIALAFCAVLAAQVAEPRIGFARSADGSVADVRGVSGSFIVDRTGARADAAAWSGRLGASLTDGFITITNAAGNVLGTLDNASGAVFGFSADGDSVAVFRPAPNDLSVWRARAWTTTPVSLGAVQSIAIGSDTSVVVAIARDSGAVVARIRIIDGAIEHEAVLDGAISPVLVLPAGRVIFADASGLAIRQSRGARTHLDLAGTPARLAQLGPDWVHVLTGDGMGFALRLTDSPAIYAIPEPQP